MPILPVPHVTQNRLRYYNLCGQTCITMLARAFTAHRPSVEAVARASGTWDNTTSTVAEMLTIGRAAGVPLQYASGAASIAWHEARILEGVPTIALLDRAKLVGGRALAHFVCVVGFDAASVYLNDPLRDSGGWRIPRAAFEAAINATVAGAYSMPRIALYPAQSLPAGEPRDVLAYALQRAAQLVDEAKGIRV